MTYHITDYHREIVALYYKKLIGRFELPNTLQHIPKLKEIVWSKKGLCLIEKHLK